MQTLIINQVINPLDLDFRALIITTIIMTLITQKKSRPFSIPHQIVELIKFESLIARLSTSHLY